jgi:hypothetical protein
MTSAFVAVSAWMRTSPANASPEPGPPADPRAAAARGQRIEHAGQLLRVRVLQRVNVDLPLAGHRHVEPPDQLQHLHVGRLRGHDDQRVGARVGDDLGQPRDDPLLLPTPLARRRRALRRMLDLFDLRPAVALRPRLGARRDAARLEDFLDLLRQLLRVRVMHRLDPDPLARSRHVQLLDDQQQALHVGAEVGDDDRVRRRVGRDVAVAPLEAVEQVRHLLRGDVVEPVDARDHPCLGRCRLAVAEGRHRLLRRPGGLGDHPVAPRRHDGHAVGGEHREEGAVRLARRHLVGAEHRGLDRAGLRAEDEAAAGDVGDDAHEHREVDVLEVELEPLTRRHRLVVDVRLQLGLGGHRALDGRRRRRGRRRLRRRLRHGHRLRQRRASLPGRQVGRRKTRTGDCGPADPDGRRDPGDPLDHGRRRTRLLRLGIGIGLLRRDGSGGQQGEQERERRGRTHAAAPFPLSSTARAPDGRPAPPLQGRARRLPHRPPLVHHLYLPHLHPSRRAAAQPVTGCCSSSSAPGRDA